MTTTTTVNNLLINKLTKAQFSSLIVSSTQLYFLTDGAEIPSVSGQSGKYLTTNGTSALWSTTTSTDTDIIVLESSGTISLTDNAVHSIAPVGAVTFQLPSASSSTQYHRILIQLYLSSVQSIDLGLGSSINYFSGAYPSLSKIGMYNVLYEYNNTKGAWIVGVIPKGEVTV